MNTNNMIKGTYSAPCILRAATVQMDRCILAGSVVDKNTAVQTKGQEVVTYDFSASSFNQVWE